MYMKKIIALAMGCMLTLSTAVFASSGFSAAVSYTAQSGEITISGKAPTSEVVVVIYPKSELPQVFSDGNLPSVIKQISVSGDYSVSLVMPDSAQRGEYTVCVLCRGNEVKESFMHINYAGAQKAVDMLSASDGQSFKNILSENALNLGIDPKDAGYIANFDEIAEIMDNMTFSDVEDFQDKYHTTYAICMIQGENDANKVDSYLSTYASNLGINYSSDFKNDTKLTTNAKHELLKLLSSTEYKACAGNDGMIDFKSVLNDLKPVAAITTSENWIGLKQVITDDFASIFSSVLSQNEKYKKISDKDAVFGEMAKANFSSISDVIKGFGDAVNTVYEKENKPKPTTSGNKGSSGTMSSGISLSPGSGDMTDNDKTKGFTDIADTHWAYGAVSTLADKGIVSGYEDNSFRADNYITRAEFTKLILSFASEIAEGENIEFSDVYETDWYYSVVKSAASKGIVSGSGGAFAPGTNIKREDAALIIYRVLSLNGKTFSGYRPFADRENVSEYARDAVFTLAGSYIINGSGDNKFLPQDSITRAEASQLIFNAFVKNADKEE